MINIIFVILGFLFFGLGAVGAFVPILPTVPFLLVSAMCFTKGSKRFEKWFLNTKLYQKYLKDFLQNRSLTLKNKFIYLGIATVMFIIAFIFVNPIVRIIILALVAFMYYYFICRIKTITKRNVII